MAQKIKLAAFFTGTSLLLCSCNKNEQAPSEKKIVNSIKPEILGKGETIRFHNAPRNFETYLVNKDSIDGTIEAPAKVVANVLKPNTQGSEVIVLFDDPELTDLYTSLLQSIAHYKRDKDFFERLTDMQKNGAATSRDLLEAQTGMVEAATELSEKEARFKMSGFEPNELRKAKPGIVWLISNVNESALGAIKTGKNCKVEFISYPGEIFNARVSAIGEVLDNATQTIKVRLTLPNTNEKFKPGMFAKISFGLQETGILAVPQTALISAQSKNYVFKKNKNEFYRLEITTGRQIGNYIVVQKGLAEGDTIVTKGAILLKGLSLGY